MDRTWGFITIATVSVGLVGNSALFWSHVKTPLNTRLTRVLTQMQFGMDALVCLVELIITAGNLILPTNFDTTSLSMGWVVIYCYAWRSQIPLFIFMYFANNNLLCLTLDRYWAVCRPIAYKEKQTRLIIFCCVLFNLAGSVQVSIMLGTYYEIVNKSCVLSWMYPFLAKIYPPIWFLVNYLLPSLVLLVVYGRIAYEGYLFSKSARRINNLPMENTSASVSNVTDQPLTTSSLNLASNAPTGQRWRQHHGVPRQALLSPTLRRVTLSMMAVSVLYILCYAMARVGTFLNFLGWVEFKNGSMNSYIGTFLATCFSALSPIVYLAVFSNYRERVLAMFRCGY